MFIRTISICAALLLANGALAEPVTVNALNFARAETDTYFNNIQKRNGGLGKLVHDREPTPIAEQTVVRMNRDTFYSSAIYDLEAGPVTVTLPGGESRFQSMQVLSEDHYTPLVAYEGTHELTAENVGTRYVLLIFRTFVDPSDPDDIASAHEMQDAIGIEQAATGSFQIPEWDKVTQDKARATLEALASLGGVNNAVRMGTKEEVDPIAHLMATATGWGLNPSYAATYFTGYPDQNDGKTVYQMVLKDVPVEGFWSVSVYNKDGFFEQNDLESYSVNGTTGQATADGEYLIQFGGCTDQVANCIPITEGWNYSLRLYRPDQSVLDGSWQAPEPEILQ